MESRRRYATSILQLARERALLSPVDPLSMSISQTRIVSSQLNIGLTPDQHAALDLAATKQGISRAAYARSIVSAPLDIADPIQPRRSTALPPADIAAIAALTGAVGKAAGVTVQLSKNLRTYPLAAAHREAEIALRDLRKISASLIALNERLNAQR